MAMDLWLAENCAQPLLRLYRWQPWAVSLGYHQSVEEIDEPRCRADGIEVVRRPTGGRAVLHAEELTYCVTVPADHPWYGEPVQTVYRRINEALCAGLRRLAPDLSTTSAATGAYARNPACFATSVRYEIALQGRKLVGSAQRRLPGGLLQHGSILLGPAHRRLHRYLRIRAGDPGAHAISMAEALGRPVGFDEAARAVIAGFEEVFAAVFEPFHWNAESMQQVEKLRENWGRKRFAELDNDV